MANARAVLLIADIGGYTRFMTVHRINLSHAQVIVARLLEAVIDAARPSFKLSKLEGDAAFFFAQLPEGQGPVDLAPRVAEIRQAFLSRRAQLDQDRLCTCDACTQTGQLKLKFVATSGEVAFQKVKGLTELAGVAVIAVHRLLKNHVPLSEYLLMTEELFAALPEAVRQVGHGQPEDLEGLGTVDTHYLELGALAAQLPPLAPRQPSLLAQVLNWLRLTWRSLPFFVGAQEPCLNFRNLEEARGQAQASLPPHPG